jgi:hypothetical protein
MKTKYILGGMAAGLALTGLSWSILSREGSQTGLAGAEGPRILGWRVEPIEPVEVQNSGAAQACNRVLWLSGAGFYGTSFGPYVYLDGQEAPAVMIDSDDSVRAWIPSSVAGSVQVRLVNPDSRFVEVQASL